MRKTVTLFLLAVILALLTSGCYTVLKKPGEETSGKAGDYFSDDVIYLSPNYYWDHPRWGQYYVYPWWWDYDWSTYYRPPGETYDGPRSADGPKGVRRGTDRTTDTGGTTAVTRESSPSSSSTSRSKNTDNDSDDSQENDSSNSSEDNSQKTKTPRRGGGRE